MNYKELLIKTREYLNMPDEKPACFSDERFIYCYCGKCKQKDYVLPEDFRETVAKNAANYYLKLKGKL